MDRAGERSRTSLAQRPAALLEPAGHTAGPTNTTQGREVGHDPGEGGEMRPRGTDTRPAGKALGQGVTPTYPGSGHRVSTSPEAAALPGFSSMSRVMSVFGCPVLGSWVPQMPHLLWAAPTWWGTPCCRR